MYYLDATDQDPAAVTAEIGPVTLHLSNTQQGTTGVPMIVFGLGMLGLAYRGKKSGG